MDAEEWLLQVTLYTLSGTLVVIWFGFRFLLGKIETNASIVNTCKADIQFAIAEQDDKIARAIDRMAEKVTTREHCDHKQETWQLRFDALLVMNRKEHDDLQLVFKIIQDKLDGVADCVSKLANKKEC